MPVPPDKISKLTAPRGLLVPGAATLSGDDELVAIRRSTGGRRFQKYRARGDAHSWMNFVVGCFGYFYLCRCSALVAGLDNPQVSRDGMPRFLPGGVDGVIARRIDLLDWVECRAATGVGERGSGHRAAGRTGPGELHLLPGQKSLGGN
ncbi:MAG: hypothetical protein DLM60_20390 [Pseudonocardiales bacterium]|nr:MAG: hypothetical protein DLM60_20390 [Pseudonocardiales bacterium]